MHRALTLILLLAVLVLVFTSRLLALGGVNPDLPLIFFAWLLSAPSLRRMRFGSFSLLILLFLGFMALVSTFWLPEATLFGALVLAAFYPSTLLSGHRLFDFLIIQVVVSFVFYVLGVFIFHGAFPWVDILFEAAYGILLSLAAYLFLHAR